MYYIGIDIGGMSVACGITDEKFNIIYKDSVPTEAKKPGEEIVADIIGLVKKVMDKVNAKEADIKSIGIGAPGMLDRENGVIVRSSNINFRNTEIRKLINEQINVPVYVDNDANCAALGEAVSGSTKEVNNSVMITLGTGVGGGVILNKKIYSGFNGHAGELGHTVIVYDGEPCGCGRKGCWETYASVTALIRQTKKAIEENPESILAKSVDGEVNGKTAFDAMRAGCPVGKKVVEQYIKYVAVGITDIINILMPEMIAIGGGISKEGDALIKPLIEEVTINMYKKMAVPTKIVTATLGNDAGIIGAAALGVD
ncbi:MAG: ROK family protein [Clostridia bacterium]|nr:ROK family protein [Clostridia bacterium]